MQSERAKAEAPKTRAYEPERRNALDIEPQKPAVSQTTANTPPTSTSPAITSLVSSSSSFTVSSGEPAVSQPHLTMLGISAITRGEEGAEIVKIALDSPSEIVGLRTGYLIVSVDGHRVRSVSDLEAKLVNRAPGSKVSLGYWFPSNLGWMPGTDKVVTLHR